ncbi:MAG: hypothetical protein ACLP50_07530, partial [Solirubrobacteraceae bacterium]
MSGGVKLASSPRERRTIAGGRSRMKPAGQPNRDPTTRGGTRRAAAGVDAPASIIAAPQRTEDEVEERLLSILEDAPDMLYAYDREGRLLFGNRE